MEINHEKLNEKITKLDYTLLPWCSLEEIIKVLEFGAKKHGRFSWREYPTRSYISAIARHLSKIMQGEYYDNETELSHYAHIACSCLFLIYKLKHKTHCDDSFTE